MLPLLRLTSDGRDHKVTALIDELAQEFGLTEEDRDRVLASGQRVIFNRTHWATTYLVKAGLLTRAIRGTARITDRGRQVLADPPARIDVKFLTQYPEFEEFRARTKVPPGQVAIEAVCVDTQQDPEELLDATYLALRRSVEADLLDHVLASTPEYFEQLVLELLLAMGYGGAQAREAARHVGRSGDDGIDGVIDQDKLGLDAVYIQAKRWAPERPVRRPELQAFAGSLEGQRATKGSSSRHHGSRMTLANTWSASVVGSSSSTAKPLRASCTTTESACEASGTMRFAVWMRPTSRGRPNDGDRIQALLGNAAARFSAAAAR